MEVIMTSKSETNSMCCPEFDPSLWDDKLLIWNNKKFIKDSVCTIFYMPLNFSRVMKRLDKTVTKAGAVMPDGLCLSDHTSKWKMDIYLDVDKKVPDAENRSLNGNFFCKVYEGSFRDTGKWCNDFETILKSKGYKKSKLFFWYTTCPKCAKKYGKNYVAIIAQIE
jgi:hypothetical protein